MDKESREFLDTKFNPIDGKIEENKRYFRQVAEGHGVIGNEIEALRKQNEQAHGFNRTYLPFQSGSC